MKILIVGGTGVISGSVVKKLCAANNDVYLLNRGNNLIYNDIAKYIISDINNVDYTKDALNELSFDVIIDFIAFTPEEMKKHLDILSNRCKQYIFISSCGIFIGNDNELLTEKSEKFENSKWKYLTDKIECEKIITEYYKEKENYFTIVRPHHSYNDYSFPAFIPSSTPLLLKRIYNDKPLVLWNEATYSKVNITHGDDFAAALEGLLLNDLAKNEDFNIVNPEAITWENAVKKIYKAAQKEPLIAYFDAEKLEKKIFNIEWTITNEKIKSHIFDISKLKAAVPDFKPSISFELGSEIVVKNAVNINKTFHPVIDVPIDILLEKEDFKLKSKLNKNQFSSIKSVKNISLLQKLEYTAYKLKVKYER